MYVVSVMANHDCILFILQLHLPMHTTLPGHELTAEPFRWDQRLFSIILRMPGTRSHMPGKIGVQTNDPAIAAMCEVTGGIVILN